MKPLNTQFFTLLTALAFLGFTVSAIAGKPSCPDGSCNGNETPASCPVDCDGGGSGGQEYPTYDVTFNPDNDLYGSGGTKWQSGQKQEGITYFLSDQQGGTGVMDLSYFRAPSPAGPFTYPRGENCFDQPTPINAVQFYGDKNGWAIFKGSFIGHSDDGVMDFMYLFTLKGYFDDPSDWLPQVFTTVTISSWELKLAKKREDNLYSNITCTGGGSLVDVITVSRN
jgi:hypothetical protein